MTLKKRNKYRPARNIVRVLLMNSTFVFEYSNVSVKIYGITNGLGDIVKIAMQSRSDLVCLRSFC